jgi:predicted ABC-type ATPase
MTSKEIFEAIDLEKVGPELKTKLLALEKATEGFTNERADARMETSMNAVYNFIKDKKPEALKNVEVKTVTVEETVTKTQGGKKMRTKQTIRKKVAGKRKKNTKKTPTPSAKNPMPNVPQIAREIREEGESWSDALSRAKVIYNKKKDDQKVKAKKALDDLRGFMKSDKFLKGWPRTYGKENAADNDIERDLARPAKAPGRRISKTGRVYYENRDNRSDREANTFPRKIYLKGGGKLPEGTTYYGVNEIESVELQDGTKMSPAYGLDSWMVSGIYVSPKSTAKKDEFQTELEFAKGGLTKSDYFYIPRAEVKRVVLDEAIHDSEEIDGDKVLNGIWMKKTDRTKQLEKEFSAREAKRRLKKMELGGEVYVQPTIIQNNPDYLVGTTTMYEMFELGGQVMVQPTILQNNPDYITSTATMSDYFEKGGNVYSSESAWEVKVMRDDEVLETFMVRGRNRGEAREVVEDYHEDKMQRKHGEDIFFAIEEAPAKFAKGGAMEHMIMKGDKVLAIHRNMLIVESDLGQINVLDLSTEPIARRISIEPITGKNTLSSAREHIDYLVSRKPKTMAMGGSLQGHGLKEGDLIVEDLGSSIMVLDEDGETFYVDLREGERYSEEPLPFDNGGEVKIGDIARLAAKYNKTGQEVAAAISEGADVEVEHTEDRKKAMRIAVDHLDEDFYYYPKLKAAEGQPDFSDFYEKGGEVPEQFLDSKGERKIDTKSIEELTDYVMALPQTKSIYFNQEAQEYVPSRRKLHADIINKFKEEVVCITEGQPIAIFMGGSPASGKSSFLRKYSPYLLKEEILKVDADEIRAMLPEYGGYNAAQTHLETKDIVNTLLSNKNIGIPCDFDLIYDGTMNSVKSYIPLMDILRKRGYKIFIVYMDKVPKDVIIKRALERYKKSGRFVPLEVIEDFFEKGTAAFNQLKKDVDGYMVIDGSNQDYEIIEQGGIKLPTNREYSKLGSKIDPKDIPALYKKGGKTKKA